MQGLIAALLVAHGIAHTVGFAVPWRLVRAPDLQSPTAVLGGAIDLGDDGARLLGVAWLALGIAFGWLGVALWLGTWSDAAAIAVLTVSSALCVLAWPHTSIGLCINLAILVLVVSGRHFIWVPAL
jgi:hypothetical protein